MRRPLIPSLVAALLLLAAAVAVTPLRAAEAPFDRTAAEHLLNRAGFGGTPAEIDALAALGRAGAVARIVGPGPADQLAALPTFDAEPVPRPTRRELQEMSEEDRKKARNEVQRKDREQLEQYRSWWVERMVKTPHPLEEKMVLFWHGYFTTSVRDLKGRTWLMIQQNRLFRRHALGNFRTLLHEASRDPAMLLYLDNNLNRKGNPNENFAREVMELFTLGLGNYTEKDIKEAARAFTGWTLREAEFVFARRQHDEGPKTVLGKTGNFDGDQVLDLLLEQPAAPRHLATRLLDFFVGPDVPPALVDRTAALLRKHDWELRPVLTALFADPDFYRPEVVGNRIVGPVEFVVGISRRIGEAPPGQFLASSATLLGQSLFDPPNVKGWEGNEAWITTSTFLHRGNVARYLVEGIDPRRIRQDFLNDPVPTDGEGGMMEPPAGRRPGAGGRRPGQGKGQGQGPGQAPGQGQGQGEGQGQAKPGAGRAPQLGVGNLFGGMRGIRWAPTGRLRDLPEVQGARSAAELIDRLCDRFLAVPVTDEARASLLSFLEEEGGAGSGDKAYRTPAEARLKRLVHLILSLPEAQLG